MQKYRVKVDVSYIHFQKDFNDVLEATSFMVEMNSVESKDPVKVHMTIVDIEEEPGDE